MPSFGPDNREIHGRAVTLVPADARTTNGTGSDVVTGDANTLRSELDVTAMSGGSPSLTVTVEHSGDGTDWTPLASFPAVTTTGRTRKVFGGVDRHVRATWALTGSATFSLSGELV